MEQESMKKSNYAVTHTCKRMLPIAKILIGIGITIVLICFIFVVTLGIMVFFPPDPEISTDMTEYISEKYVEKDAGDKAKQFLPSYKSLESYTDISYQHVNNDLRCFFSFISEDFITPDVFSVTVTYDKATHSIIGTLNHNETQIEYTGNDKVNAGEYVVVLYARETS